ncbi:L,D-transpeptidase [Cohnella soli]|uniref:L,D-transpeptidase n=1 Tax=Cohnella soli TaxID=425005 RepID=A0ABW0HYR8_9BACL
MNRRFFRYVRRSERYIEVKKLSKESRIDEQIKHFYDNVPNVGDALPLKEYLLKHEDSRMAWYLLGKEYEGKGDMAKATYCYAQAGDIYTAFEGKPAPVLPGEKTKGNNRKKWAIALLLPLLLAAGAIYAIRALSDDGDEVGATQQPTPSTPYYEGTASAPPSSGKDGGPDHVKLPAGFVPPGLIAGASGPDARGRDVLGSLLTGKRSTLPRLLVETPQLGKWSDWVKTAKPIAEVMNDPEAGTANVRWYNPKWCDCKPDDPSAATRKQLEGWKPVQEEKAVLRSAMIRYKETKGKWPSSPEQLAADYPNNTMAGWTDNMTPWFEELKSALNDKKDGKLPQTPGWPENTGPETGHGTPAGQLAPVAEQPLQIVIDKTHHRLAVVSGDVILRNYAVGLGGDKTPEGAFVISEKVKDPNGSSTGVFGSRGMTLSDSRYGIHGTDEPNSIGKDESHGCVRMKKEDIEELYDLVPLGTPVTIAKGGLPSELRTPSERFRLKSEQNETNPRKVYDWLN